MPDVSYFVRLFRRKGDDLVASDLIEADDYLTAIGEAMRRAQEEAAGAIVFAKTDDKGTGGAREIIIKIGDVPDALDALGS
jgi:hypothetical protein